MTTQSARDAQRQATRDLFAAFATSITPTSPWDAYVTRKVLARLTDISDPLTNDVLQAIFAERRRRLSAATREGRRAG